MMAWLTNLFAQWLAPKSGRTGGRGTAVAERAREARRAASPPRGDARPAEPGDRRSGADRRRSGSDELPPGIEVDRRRGPRSMQREPEEEELAELPELPDRVRDSGLESERVVNATLRVRQREILRKIGERVEAGKFQLPHLPSTSMVVMDLAANPSSEIPEIVQSLSTDPVLSTRLLRLANSAMYASQEPVETLHEAVMRVGMRELRSLIFALSMRQVIFRTEHLTSYAEETWRQAYSVAVISRAIGPICGMAEDKMFLLGLLHDVGKIALLSMLQSEIKDASDVTPALVGRVFLDYHERTGAIMAEGWKLSEEFIAVAGQHHDYSGNEQHSRSAALVSLAHRLDMNLSMGASDEFWRRSSYPELEFLGLDPEHQRRLINTAHEVYVQNLESDGGLAA